MTTNKYFKERDKLFDKTLANANREINKEIKRCYKEVRLKLEDLLLEIEQSKLDGTILHSDLYRYNRYYDLLNLLDKELNKLGDKEIRVLKKELEQLYIENAKIISKELAFQVQLNETMILNAIEGIWCVDGKSWSSRIWNNMAVLKQDIQEGIINTIVQGKSKSELVKQLQKDFGVEHYKADRICRTEIAHTQVQSTIDSYKQAGVEQYKILDTHDERCCEHCQDMNGKEFYIDDMDNLPPYHP